MARRLEITLLAGLALTAAPAGASPTEAGSVEFIWDAPSACPTEDEVAARVETLLGTPLAQATTRRVSVIARVREEDGRWNMRLFTVTPEGTRERSLDHERCDLLAEATAVVVALAIDPAAGALPADGDALALVEAPDARAPDETAEPEEEDEDEEDEEVAPIEDMLPEVTPDEPAPPSSPAEPGRAGPFGIVAVGGTVGWGALPRVTGGLTARVGVGWSRLRFEAVAHYWFASPARLDASPSHGADIDLWTLGPRACVLPFARRIELPLCGGLEAGQMTARAVDLDNPRTVRSPWVAVTFGGGLAWVPIRMLALRVDVEAFVALRRPAFDVAGDMSDLHRARIGGLRGAFSLELRFP